MLYEAPFADGRHVIYGDSVYALSREVTARAPATAYQVRIDVPQGTTAAATSVNFSDLPTVDREKFAALGLDDGGTVGVGTTFVYTDDERSKSVLVPSSKYDYIAWKDGTTAAWSVDRANDVTLKTYHYTAETVSSVAAYGRTMRERFAFDLSDLSEKEASVVRTAIDEGNTVTTHSTPTGYTVATDETPPSAFRSLVDRFRGKAQVLYAMGIEYQKGNVGGYYLPRYHGQVYWASLFVSPTALKAEYGKTSDTRTNATPTLPPSTTTVTQ
ncbi:MAG: hypothetical protein ABEJ23_09820 [Haloarculaceae archaeon]